MGIKAEIRAKWIQARKDNDQRVKTFLGVVLGELQLKETRDGEMTEDQTVKAVQKMKDASLNNYKKFKMAEGLWESDYLCQFLPEQISREQLTTYCRMIPFEGETNVGKLTGMVIRRLKVEQVVFDASQVGQIIRELLVEEQD